MSLLEKAKEQHFPKPPSRELDITDEHIELAFAWLKNEIQLARIADVLNTKPTGAGYRLARILREAYLQGKLVMK